MGVERDVPEDVTAQDPGHESAGDVQDRIRRWWNEDAATYDDTPSHAVTDPVEAAAWRAALLRHLPPPPPSPPRLKRRREQAAEGNQHGDRAG